MSKDVIDKILDEVWFEKEFYKIIANTDQYDVVDIDVSNKNSLKESELLSKLAIEAHCKKNNLKILYRISYGNYAVVLDKDNSEKVGIVPENNSDGWEC